MDEQRLQEVDRQLRAAREAYLRGDFDAHAEHVAHLSGAVSDTSHEVAPHQLVQAVAAERLVAAAGAAEGDARLQQVETEVEQLLVAVGRTQPYVGARLEQALARMDVRRAQPRWHDSAARHHVAAARLFIEAGEADHAAAALLDCACDVEVPGARLRAAHESLTEALSLARDPSVRARILAYRARVHLWLGDVDRAQSDVDVGWPIAQLGDEAGMAHVAWTAAAIASLRNQRTVVETWVERADRCGGSYYDGSTAALWHEALAVDALARVGALEVARRRLEALTASYDRSPVAVAMAQVAVEARDGGRDAATAAWEAVRGNAALPPWVIARIHLLLAEAATRAGDDGGPLAAEAFELCGGLEQPAVLLTTEPSIARALLPDAAGAGSGVAQRLLSEHAPWHIRTLGGFAVTGPGGPVALAGKSRHLLQYLAVSRRPVDRNQLAEALWPDIDDRQRRERLRRLLHRTRAVVPGVIDVLPDDCVGLSAEVSVDIVEFRARVRAARRRTHDADLQAVAAAEALAHLGGGLLPGEVVDDGWLDPLRTSLERDTAWAHTVVAEHHDGHGRDDLVIDHARAALRIEPSNETAARLAVEALHRSGRPRDAQRVLRTAEAALAELDVRPGPMLRAARARLEHPPSAES